MITVDLVEMALESAQGAQAAMQQTESTQVSFENDRLKSTQSSQRTQIEVKVIAAGKVGVSSTTDRDDLQDVVTRALEAAEFGNPAHFEFPGVQPSTEVKVHDPAVPSVTQSEMVQVGQEMIDQLKEYNSNILAYADVNKAARQTEFANSAGVSFASASTDFAMSVEGQLIRGTDILFAGHAFGWKRRDVDQTGVARKAIE